MPFSDTWYVYALIDPRTDEVRYVGVTINPQRRYGDHIKATAYETTHKANWIKQLLAIGLRPTLRILEQGSGEWVSAERRWITFFREQGAQLTNLTDGGDGVPGHRWSEEQREKIRGRTVTDESKAKISKARKGQPIDPEHHAKLLAAHTGKPLSAEHKQKLSAIHKGRVFSEESRRRMSEAQRAIKHPPLSEAHRRNLSLAKIGKPQYCGICRSPDHNRRTCPQKGTANDANESC